MKRGISLGLLGWLLGALVLGVAGGARAEEPFRAFLDELYRRRMFDVALDYLDSLRNSPFVSDEIKETLTYEEGVTLIEGASYERDIPKRKKNLDTARDKLGQFVKEHPEHPLAGSAQIQLGNILINRAQANLELAKVPSQAAKKDGLLQEARALFSEADQVCTAAEATFDAKVKAFPKFIDPQDRKQIEARDQARLDLIQARLLGAMAVYEHTKAYEKTAGEFKSLLEKGAERFGKVYDSYRKLLAGLYARMYQGRCYQDLGDAKKATSIYGELLLQPDDPQEFRELKAKTLALAMECWNGEGEKKYEESITRGEDWVSKIRGNEDRTPEGLSIQWLLSQAYSLRAATLKDDDPQKAKDHKSALDHATAVSKVPGDFQQLAREFVAKTRNIAAGAEPTNFAEAREKGQAALDALQVALSQIKLAPTTGQEAQLPEFEKQAATAREDAMRYFNLALTLRQADTPIEDVNQIRYYVSFLDYQSGRFYDAVVLGEFVARRYSQSSLAKKSAQIALASYLGAFNAASEADRKFELDRMLKLAQFTGETWPGEPEADEAWLILADLATRDGDMEQAVKYLENIPPESQKRAEADLKLGQALWSVYLRKSRLPADSQPPAEELQKLAARAQTTLEAGVKSMRAAVAEGGPITFALLTAELSLSQIYVGAASVDKAIALLETADKGLLSLVDAKDANAARGNLPVETYKVALRAYVAAQQLEKAEKMMNALEGAVGPADPAVLTRIYLGLGMELEDQVARLQNQKKSEELAKVLKGFELFLDRIAGRDQGNTFNSLMWVAETFYRLGEGLDTGSQAGDQAKAYYEKAIKTYEQVLEKSKQPGFAPTAESANSVIVRLSRCERGRGNFEAAVNRLVEVLKKKPAALEAQIEGAYTYQAWGEIDPLKYKSAIGGAKRVRKGDGTEMWLIWGWNRLAQTLQKIEQHKDLYFEARYNAADCYYRLAMKNEGQGRTDNLAKAESAITVVARLNGDFGGPENFDKYDRLLRQIRRAGGGKEEGLKAVIDALNQASASSEK